MTVVVTELIADDAGQDLAEYGIALAVISVLAGAAAVIAVWYTAAYLSRIIGIARSRAPA